MIVFSRQDVVHWSSFSGDNNQLHYSPPPGNCIVQGMLVFIHIFDRNEKRRSTNHFALKIEAFFRKPIFTDNACYVTMPDMNKIMFGCAAQARAVTATTHFTTEWYKPKKISCVERISIEDESLKNYRRSFGKVLPEPTTELSFYCALCFSVILGSRTFLTHKNITYDNPSEYFDKYRITHISQTVELSQAAFHNTFVTEQISIDALVTESNDHTISHTAVARSLIYKLVINGSHILHMKSLFLIEKNEVNKD